ncbi:UDP-glycosyltransferase 87A2-like [Andrographis paniculata]|uniref:UDP-glycosyltransferase 87A2-like n=1 Tax=Andrographis paniculata TaxID=175694 RepID=UPI001E7309EC|nr:UDP-glycosyltransferase 87A2-like [Andrographis paniculata]QZJ84677.1 UDP-glycosyltransferase 6 [Andrographis paniculata]
MSDPLMKGCCHVVAIPYPGRGHINPMLNLCRQILKKRPEIVVSFIVTEEWLGFLPPPPHRSLSFHTIPNVIPSEIGRAKDFAGFITAVRTKMEAPVERLLDRLPPPKPKVIVYDTYLSWAVAVGNRRNIPVASFFTMSATVFSIFHHFDLIVQNGHFLSGSPDEGAKDEVIEYIPGISSIRIGDLPTPFHGKGKEVLPIALEAIKLAASNSQFLLFTSIHQLESQVLDFLKQSLPTKLYSIGLSIPQFYDDDDDDEARPGYMQWLDAQPLGSVLYISQGSFLSVSSAQLDEIVAGVRDSGVRFMWVGRGEDLAAIGNSNGIVVPWCDQLRVLCHSSVGGFWSHCGWNSTKEGAFAGLPMLTFPIFWDQVTNSKMIVEDWGVGVRVMGDRNYGLVSRKEIARIVVEVMRSETREANERKRRAEEIRDICRVASEDDGSSSLDLLGFIEDICE